MLRHNSEPNKRPSAPQTIELRTKSGGSGFWFLLAAIVLAALALLAVNFRTYIGVHQGATSSQRETDRAILAAELAVRNSFGIGVVPRFAPKDWVKVERDGERYAISSWVEAIPGNGGDATSYDYSCSVFRNPSGDWAVSDINIQLQ